MQKERYGSLTEEDLDPYRVEVQSITPTEYIALKEKAKKVNQEIVSAYGDFIPPGIKKRNESLPGKIIIPHDLSGFSALLGPSTPNSDKIQKSFWVGFSEKMGFIAVSDLRAIQEHLVCGDKDAKGNELDSKAAEAVEENFLFHELTHQYQDRRIGGLLMEMGAYYTAEDLQKREERIEYSDGSVLSEGYRFLVEKFGDSVHALQFGTLNSNRDERQIRWAIPQSLEFACAVQDVSYIHFKRYAKAVFG